MKFNSIKLIYIFLFNHLNFYLQFQDHLSIYFYLINVFKFTILIDLFHH